MYSLKSITLTFLFHLLVVVGIAQTWQPMPKGNFIPSTKTTQKAIWSDDVPPNNYKKVTETFINKKPTFQCIVKPANVAPFIFKKHPLLVAEVIEYEGLFPFKDVSKLNIKYLDKAHGLFCDEITDITEDKEGLIYLSSSSALAVYNGNSFKLLKGTSEFKLNGIENLFTDSKGLIWIATYHGMAYIKDNHLYVPKNQIKDHIWRIREDHNQNIWVSTQSNGVYKIGNNTVQHYFDKNHVIESFDTYFDKNGKLWLGLHYGIAFIKNDSLFQYRLPTIIGTPATYYQHDNELWIGRYYGGLQKIRNDSLFDVEAETTSRSVYEITSDDRGLWFSSYGNGMRLITKQNLLVTFNKSEGLSNNGSIYFYIDRFSNVWVSDGQQGLSRIDDNVLFYSRENVGGGNISDIEKFENDVWYFYNGDYLRRIINGKRYKYTNQGTDQIPPNRHHIDGCVVGKNEAWLANYNSGMVHLKDEQVTYFRTNESEYENTATNLELDTYNRLWYLNMLNGLRYIKNDSIFTFNATSFKNYLFQDIVYGKHTNFIYAVSDKDVIIIAGEKYKIINNQKSVLALIEDEKGGLWIFMEDGIKVYHELKETQSISTNLFKSTVIKSIEIIKENNFLMATSDGLMELWVLKDKINYKKYNQTKGLHLSNISLIKAIDSSIVVIAKNDIYYYNSLLTAKNRAPPLLKLEKVLINSEEVPITNIVLEQDQSIDFLFNIINWGDESLLNIKIDKDGTKGKWRNQNTKVLSLQELSYGKYSINVKIIGDSDNSEILTLQFVVKPYFYQMKWFIILLILVVLILIFGYFNHRIQKNKKQTLVLEKKIEEKTKEITVEKNKVVEQLNEKELLLKEVNHRVKNNFQMVSSLLELQASRLKSKEALESLTIAVSRIKSLALAHNKLYDSENYTDISLNEYIQSIVSNLNISPDTNVEVYFDKVYSVNIEKAQALGFIINELITNSIKHAWKKNAENKKITINFSNHKNKLTFKYTDNGIGFGAVVNIQKNQSLGFMLINSFVSRQLMGGIELINENGAVTIITFNEDVLK